MWIKRLNDERKGKWKSLFWNMLSIDNELLNKNINYRKITGKTKFHTQMLASWYKLIGTEPKDQADIANQFIVSNQYVKINDKPINDKSLHNIKLKHLCGEDGKIIGINQLNFLSGTTISQMQFNAIISAIPTKWKSIMTKHRRPIINNNIPISNSTPNENENELIIKLYNKNKHITLITNKDIYNTLITQMIQNPTAENKWYDLYPALEHLNWTVIYILPNKISNEPYLQTFQYKVLNRIVNCNERLFKFKKSENCLNCNQVDTIEHHLVSCEISRKMWKKLEEWITQNLDINFPLTECEILFGIPNNNDIKIQIINFLILLTKWFINHKKTQEKELYFIDLLTCFRDKVKLNILIQSRENIFKKDWVEVLNDAL